MERGGSHGRHRSGWANEGAPSGHGNEGMRRDGTNGWDKVEQMLLTS